MGRSRAAALLALAFAAAACGRARSISGGHAYHECTTCHGGGEDDSGAPPTDHLGRSDPSLPSVGAHGVHVRGAGLHCDACHPDPREGSTVHANGTVNLAFGPLATAGGTLSPSFDPATGCSATYCHGGFPGGNSGYVPNWTHPRADACGTCHGDPSAAIPALPTHDHPALAAGSTAATCAVCHADTLDASGALRAGGPHLDGKIDVDPAARHPAGWTDASSPDFHGRAAAADPAPCARCHAATGSARVTAVTCASCHDALAGGADWTTTCFGCHGTPASPAPPPDTSGEVATTALGVGAHQSHVTAASGLSAPLGCESCHAVPTNVLDAGHLDGQVTVTGYTGSDPAWSAAAGSPGWDPTTATCATAYCHGNFRGGNAANAPVWTEVGQGQAACGTCHSIPPPASVGHPQTTNCGACHPGYTSTSVNPATHVNGRVDVLPMACTSCHGDATRVATPTNPMLPAAPPVDTTGASDPSSPGVGAHQAHLQDGALRAALSCGECHTVPQSTESHPTGTLDLTWGPLASAGGAKPSFDGTTCSSTYCHGATLGMGGTNHAPRWTGGPAEAACGTCHGAPPPPETGHPQSTACGGCHRGYTATTVNVATHVDGKLDVNAMDSCTGCHGDATRTATATNPELPAAPPIDTLGDTATTAPGVGAHQAHLNDGALRYALPCTECHVVPTSIASHPTGTLNLTFGPLATTGGTTPSFDGARCASTYCHGATLGAGGTDTAPSWTGGQAEAACGTCHSIPPPASSGHPQTTNCGSCHPGYTATSVDPSKHVNGVVDVLPMTCTSCHGDPTRAATTANPALPAAPPADTTGATDTSSPGVGAHQAHLTDGPMRAAIPCEECHPVPTSTSHSNGQVDFSWGALATANGASPSFQNLQCASTYCHGATLAGAGGTNTTPTWNAAPGTQVACGTCHATPPPASVHPSYMLDGAHVLNGATLPSAPCAGCHPATATVDANGGNAIDVAGGKHVDGAVEYTFTGHPAGWANLSDAVCGGQHGCLTAPSTCASNMNAYYGGCADVPSPTCIDCHGDGSDLTPDGGPSHVSCAACHPKAFGSTTCASFGLSSPCGCDLCHGPR